jgi:iron complex outermembrane receptor protein
MAEIRVRALALMTTAVIAALPWAALAQQAEQVLPEVKVRAKPPAESPVGPDDGYRATRSNTATKSDTPLMETPQSITIVTRERMEDQGATSLQDALNYAAGVRSDAYGLDSRTDSVRVRGSYPDEYRDGLRRLFGYYTSTARIEPYALERIEVLRGPASMLYGQGTPAGIVNSVSKRPLAEPRHDVGVQLGSFGRKQVQTDLAGPITKDGEWSYRLVALARKSDTQVDHVPDDRLIVAPALTWRPNGATSLTLLGSFQDDRTGSTSQFFPWSASLGTNPNGRVSTSTFIGEPGFDRYDTERAELGWLFEHKLNDAWQFKQAVRFSHNENEYRSIYADSFTSPANPFLDPAQRVMNRIAWQDRRKNNMWASDQHLEGRFATGAVNHQLLLGLDALDFKESSRSAFGAAPAIDIYNPVYTGFTPLPYVDNPDVRTKHFGVYVQDQMKMDRWIFVAGLRRDSSVSSQAGAADNEDDAWSKRLGLMYRLPGGFAPYLSYAESFTPVPGASAVTNTRFKPQRGKQLEGGVKYERGRMTYTAALYELDEENIRIPDPLIPTAQTQAGKTTTRGFELEAVGALTPRIDVAAHYNFIDIDPTLEGIPEHQAAIWGTYRFEIGRMDGFKAGLGWRYMSAFRDNQGGAGPEVPSVKLLDAMIARDQGPWRYALNVQNLADKVYVATCLGRGDCWFGNRRTIVASATYRF